MEIRANIADEINRHNTIATTRAEEAIHHAREAGLLLLEVKAALPHGQFGAWLEQNITVSVRQAQRYIAVAEGKQIPIRSLTAKYDTTSHLTSTSKPWALPPDQEAQTLFGINDDDSHLIRIQQSHQCPGFYFACHHNLVPAVDGRFSTNFTMKPLHQEWVPIMLKKWMTAASCPDEVESLEWVSSPAEIGLLQREEVTPYLPQDMAHLIPSEARTAADRQTPTWTPKAGHWHSVNLDGIAFWIVPSLEHPGFFHVSKFCTLATSVEDVDCYPDSDDVSQYDGTRQPVWASAVEATLQHFGMLTPSQLDWSMSEKPGLSRPFGEPENN